jgi:hypothetical protein
MALTCFPGPFLSPPAPDLSQRCSSLVIFVETERGRRRGEEPYFPYGDDPRRRHRDGIGEKHQATATSER